MVDKQLCDEIQVEARKRYVGKVAEARASALFASEPDPCKSSGGFIFTLLVVGVIGVGTLSYRTWSNSDARPVGSGTSSSVKSWAQDVSLGKFRTALGVVNDALSIADKACSVTGRCGFDARTSDPMAEPDGGDIYRLSYEPRQDDSTHVGWAIFKTTARLLHCDLRTAFGWTAKDETAGEPSHVEVTVFC